MLIWSQAGLDFQKSWGVKGKVSILLLQYYVLRITVVMYKLYIYGGLCKSLKLGFLSDKKDQKQGWEFAHLISERIARFLSKNERMSDLLKKMSDSLTLLIWFERNERFTQIAHQKRGNEWKWAIR